MHQVGAWPRPLRGPAGRASRRPGQAMVLLLALLAALAVTPSASGAAAPVASSGSSVSAVVHIPDPGWVGSAISHHGAGVIHTPTAQRSGAAVAVAAFVLAALAGYRVRTGARPEARVRSTAALPRRRGPPHVAFTR